MAEPPRIPSWLAPAVVVLMVMQLALLWLQGGLLHRQHQDLVALREEVQELTDTVSEGLYPEEEYEESAAPIRHRRHAPRLLRVQALADEDPARKELQESAASGQKAVEQVQEVQSKLSIAEAARKAEEKAKVEEAESGWQKWLLVALGVGLLAWVIRAWIQRRD